MVILLNDYMSVRDDNFIVSQNCTCRGTWR
jgi:hypothetical protein